MKKEISIIMPVYNTEPFLAEAIESILNQSFKDFELICINDKSTDTSLEILKDYQKKDSRIKIFSNIKHYGAALSRNRGLKEAVGKYLTFLDSDDIFHEEMLECAYLSAEKYSTDVIMFERMHVPSKDIRLKRKVFHSEMFYERYSNKVFQVKNSLPYEFLNWQLAPSNKLYNRDFIVSNNLEFQDLSCANDVYFVCMSIMLAKRLLFLKDDRVMVYARVHNSLSRISYDRDPYCSYFAFEHIAEELKKRDRFSEFYSYFYYRFFGVIVGALNQCKKHEKEQEFYYFLQEEGIDKICSDGKGYYDKLDSGMKGLLDRFKTGKFESEWYKRKWSLKILLCSKVNVNRLINLFQNYKEHDKAVALWGAGANGISLLEFCNENSLKIDMVVDKSKEKQGNIVNGYLVKAPEDIDDKIQVVIITARNIFHDVTKELSGKKIEVIDINQFFVLY